MGSVVWEMVMCNINDLAVVVVVTFVLWDEIANAQLRNMLEYIRWRRYNAHKHICVNRAPLNCSA